MSNHNDDDFIEVDHDDSGLEDFETGSKVSFADAWKSNPMVKIGVVVGGLAILIGGVILFGGSAKPVSTSTIIPSPASSIKVAPGQEASPAYDNAVRETNDRSVEDALRNNTSSLPVPIGASKGKVALDGPQDSAEDPLERWKRIQEERTKKEQAAAAAQPTQQQAPTTPVDPYAAQKQTLSQSMQTQMQSILEAQTLKQPINLEVTDESWLEAKRKKEEEALNVKVATAQAAAAAAVAPAEILLEPGRIEYAQLIIEANSDVPGPVLAELASGPLVGDRMIGSFSKQDDFLTLKFDTVVVDGVGLSTEAVALDPKTSRPGLVTDIDHKYFTRVILPAASAFITGIGGAIAESGTTTVAAGEGTVTSASNPLDTKQEFFKGVEKGSSKLGEVLDRDSQNVEPRVRVAAGTHIGILFTKACDKGITE